MHTSISVIGTNYVGLVTAACLLSELELCADAYAVADGVDDSLALTEWPEFKRLDYRRILDSMRQAILVDGRNLLDPGTMQALGFRYRGIGRGLAPQIEPHARFIPSRVALAA